MNNFEGIELSDRRNTFVFKNVETGLWISKEGWLPDDIDYLKEHINDSDLKIEFRECYVCNCTYRQAFDLVSKHLSDYFESVEWVIDAVDYSAPHFINERICGVIAEIEDLEDWEEEAIPSFDLKSWNDDIEPFLWDRVLDEEESKQVIDKYLRNFQN